MTNELQVVHGDHTCTEAVPSDGAVCDPAKTDPVLTSGICSVGEVGIFINGNDDPDEAVEFRYCDGNDPFFDGGFYTIVTKTDRFEICKTDLTAVFYIDSTFVLDPFVHDSR